MIIKIKKKNINIIVPNGDKDINKWVILRASHQMVYDTIKQVKKGIEKKFFWEGGGPYILKLVVTKSFLCKLVNYSYYFYYILRLVMTN
jgi:hypothetical protein